ncbi:MAG: fasciclin domain-containing protein [Candidatus Gastranaerophilales bacterium]|nr:fasciclin domain-containing protein [Candidatus Gastranaerophilales bacterium]
MKKVLILMSAFAMALVITLSSYAACPCQTPATCPCTKPAPCCETPAPCCDKPAPCCETPAPCCEKPACPCESKPCCKQKCQGCNVGVINLDKACGRTSFEVIKKSCKLSKFEGIIKKAGMEEYYECGNYIAFVPTNCALKDTNLKCPEAAKKFVLKHLADAKCYPEDLCKYTTIKNLCGEEFCITQNGNLLSVGKSTVVVDNVKTKNGRIYVLDKKLH